MTANVVVTGHSKLYRDLYLQVGKRKLALEDIDHSDDAVDDWEDNRRLLFEQLFPARVISTTRPSVTGGDMTTVTYKFEGMSAADHKLWAEKAGPMPKPSVKGLTAAQLEVVDALGSGNFEIVIDKTGGAKINIKKES